MTGCLRIGTAASVIGLALLFLSLMLWPVHAGEPSYCDDWRQFERGAATSSTSEFWSFALAKYCHGSPARNTLLNSEQLSSILDDRINDWRARCSQEYVSWQEDTGTVVRRVSQGRRVLCPLPL